ncbi:MAG: cardiolipin synthase [Actinomycetales bacterium]|nr:cardiolipin synthase [Actinomycetales bacterium]
MNAGQLVATVGILLPLIIPLYVVAVAILLINDQRDPTRTLTWLLFMFLLPGVGLLLYFFLGRNLRKRTMRSGWWERLAERAGPVHARLRGRYAAEIAHGEDTARELGFSEVLELAETGEGSFPLPAYDVRILASGAEKFDQLKKDLAAARDTINLMYFIWERDELTQDLIDILSERARAGVEVRMLNDYIGNIIYRKDQLKQLTAAGGRVSYDVRDLGQANYRNHRKIVVIDGVLGYTGGCNVGQEYIDGGKRYPAWRDTHVVYGGPAVAALQTMFAARWLDVEKEDLFTDRFFPPEYPPGTTATPALTVSTGVDAVWEVARRAHVVGIGEASQRVWIQSPYYVPTAEVQAAITNAALAGLDVRLMMTGIPDKRSAWYAANTYIEPLLRAGVRVYHYTAGFFHAKSMTLDGKVFVIGTLNLDIRSLELHKELMVWFLDPELTRQHDALFEADIAGSRELTLADFAAQTRLQRFRDSAYRLASNLL